MAAKDCEHSDCAESQRSQLFMQVAVPHRQGYDALTEDPSVDVHGSAAHVLVAAVHCSHEFRQVADPQEHGYEALVEAPLVTVQVSAAHVPVEAVHFS
jgi:hypothetical protein